MITMNNSEKNGVKSNLTQMISPYSISVYAEAAGHDDVTDEALSLLSLNVSEMLYELLKDCKTEMKVYRQDSLSNNILSNVFQTSGIQPMYGCRVDAPFVKVASTDISVLHTPKLDLIAEAAAESVTVDLEPVPFVRGLFVSPALKFGPEFNVNTVKMEPGLDLDECRTSYPLYTINHEYSLKKMECDYFLVVSQAILSSSENLLKILFEDLRSNPRIGGVYCTLLNFVGNAIRDYKYVGRLVDRLLGTIDALLDNPYFDPSSTHCVDDAIRSLCTLIQESKIANDCDDFLYRRRASYLLMKALNFWNVDKTERIQILDRLNLTSRSPEKMSLKWNYSVLMMFYGLGFDLLDSLFWPFLDKYLNVLSSLDEIVAGKRSFSFTTDICHVKTALLLVAGILYRNFWVEDESVQFLHFKVDTLLRTYFDEAIAPIRVYAVPRPSPLYVYSTGRSLHDESVDVRKNYQKINLFALRRKRPTMNVPIKTTRSHHYVNDVFFASLPYRRNTPIIFNFIGSNQRNHEQLKTKKLDQRYNVQYQQSGHVSRPFLEYEKVTRNIKYCKTRPSFVGDIYLSL